MFSCCHAYRVDADITTLGLEPLRPETMQRPVCAQDLSGS